MLTMFTVMMLLMMDGRTNSFEGVLLLALYLILGISFFFVPREAILEHVRGPRRRALTGGPASRSGTLGMVTLVLRAALSLLAAGGVAWCADLADHVNPFTGTRRARRTSAPAVAQATPFRRGRAVRHAPVEPRHGARGTNFAGGYTYDDTQYPRLQPDAPERRRLRDSSRTCRSCRRPCRSRSPAVAGTYDVDPAYVPSFTTTTSRRSPASTACASIRARHAIDVALAAARGARSAAFAYPPRPTASVLFNAGGSAMANGDVDHRVDPRAARYRAPSPPASSATTGTSTRSYFVAPVSAGRSPRWGTWRADARARLDRACGAHRSAVSARRLPDSPNMPHASNTAQARRRG